MFTVKLKRILICAASLTFYDADYNYWILQTLSFHTRDAFGNGHNFGFQNLIH